MFKKSIKKIMAAFCISGLILSSGISAMAMGEEEIMPMSEGTNIPVTLYVNGYTVRGMSTRFPTSLTASTVCGSPSVHCYITTKYQVRNTKTGNYSDIKTLSNNATNAASVSKSYTSGHSVTYIYSTHKAKSGTAESSDITVYGEQHY